MLTGYVNCMIAKKLLQFTFDLPAGNSFGGPPPRPTKLRRQTRKG